MGLSFSLWRGGVDPGKDHEFPVFYELVENFVRFPRA
jgi:hypothetical protein